MNRFELSQDIADLGDAAELTRGQAPVGLDDTGGVLYKNIGLSDED